MPSRLRVPLSFEERYLAETTGFWGQTSQVIKLSMKSKKNNNVNVSSKRPVFGTKMVKNFFVNYRFSDKGRTIVLSGTCPPLVLSL